MNHKIAAGLTALVMLAGCSGSPDVVEGEPGGADAAAMPSWSADEGPVTWTCSGEADQGVGYTFTLPTDMDHEGVVMMEELRQKLGGDEVHYIVVEIDATQTDRERGSAASLEWATAEQTSASADGYEWALDEWREGLSLSDNDDIDLYNEGVDVSNTLNDTVPNRGAKGYKLFVVDEPVTSMVAPVLYPDVSGGLECTR